MKREERKRAPLVLGIAFSMGGLIGAMIGPYFIGWGVALALSVALTIVSVGLLFEDDVALAHVVRGLLAGALGFVLATIAMTWPATANMTDEAFADFGGDLDSARRALMIRWAVSAAGIPVALVALIRRRRD